MSPTPRRAVRSILGDYQAATQKILVSQGNQKILQNNIELLKGQLVPLINNKLMSKENKLYSIEKRDPVAWKHNLDDKVRDLTAAAGVHSVKLPPNFYFTFANYLNQHPSDDQTEVLSKQLLAVELLTNILINAPVQSIIDIQRTNEEDAHASGARRAVVQAGVPDRLGGFSGLADGGAYRVYPCEIEFEATEEGFRKVMNELIQSPYIFVIRTVISPFKMHNPFPPRRVSLIKWSGPRITPSPRGLRARSPPPSPPRARSICFGNSTLHVKMRVDLIEWLTPAPPADKPDTQPEITDMSFKSPEPIVLAVALLLLAIGAGTLAYEFPPLSEIVGFRSMGPKGQTLPAHSRPRTCKKICRHGIRLLSWKEPSERSPPAFRLGRIFVLSVGLSSRRLHQEKER